MTRYALRFRDGTIQVRRVADDGEIARFQARGDREIYVFGFSPDGRYLATTHFPGVRPDGLGHRPAHGRRERPGPRLMGRPNSARTAGGSPWSIRMGRSSSTTWRPVNPAAGGAGRHRRRTWPSARTGPRSRSFTTIRRTAPAGSWKRRRAGSSGRSRCPPRESVAWSPDGTTLATACDDPKIYLWDAATGTRKAVLEGSTNSGLIAAFHPSGTLAGQQRLGTAAAALGRGPGPARAELDRRHPSSLRSARTDGSSFRSRTD